MKDRFIARIIARYSGDLSSTVNLTGPAYIHRDRFVLSPPMEWRRHSPVGARSAALYAALYTRSQGEAGICAIAGGTPQFNQCRAAGENIELLCGATGETSGAFDCT